MKTLLHWFDTSPVFKLFAILILVLLLLIPTSDVKDLIWEREAFQKNVVQEISEKWGQEQALTGPILTIPYSEIIDQGKNTEYVLKKHLHILPEQMHIEGQVEPQIRNRGIYKALLYTSEIDYRGSIKSGQAERHLAKAHKVHLDEAILSFGINDPKGIRSALDINLNGKTIRLEPGTPSSVKFSNGFSAQVDASEFKDFEFQGHLKLNGSAAMQFVPLARETSVHLTSTWPDPGFSGSFLPEMRTVTEGGFDAVWKVYDFNRTIPHIWNDEWVSTRGTEFGFSMVDEVNVYQKTMRSAKYAFMIISLTFTFFFFFEIIRKMRIHPIQYSVVGIGICVFYTLLLALSEHVSFMWAYLISALAICSITIYYFYHVSKSRQATALFAAVFVSLYTFIFTILNLESHALLVGSIGVFVALALVMYHTRHIDWYGKPSDPQSEDLAEATGIPGPA